MCFCFLFLRVFCAIFWEFFRFLKETHKNEKNIANKTQIQSKTKTKTRTCLIAFVLLFDCICFTFLLMFVALFVPFWCIFVACFVHFLHVFSGQMVYLFSQFVCFVHSKASFGDLFLRFLCIFFGIGFAFVFAIFMFR